MGKYTQIRMEVEKVVVTHEGTEKDAVLPGDKLKVVRPFDVAADAATVLTLDFDAAQSVIITGEGRVQFKPVVKLLIRSEDRGPAGGAPSQGGRPESSGSGRPSGAGQSAGADGGAGRPADAGQPSEGQATSTPGQSGSRSGQ